MRRLLGVGVAVVLVVATACSGDEREPDYVPGPGPSQTKVDTPELVALKATTGMEDCAPGPGGGALPDLTLPCLGGGTSVDLASLRGPMLLSLWYAGCGPCRKEMPALQRFHTTYGDQVPVLGLDILDQYPGSALQEVRDRKVTYPSVADPGGDVQAFEEFAKLPGFPVLYFIDGAGEVAFVHPGGVDSAAEVTDLVREHLGVDL